MRIEWTVENRRRLSIAGGLLALAGIAVFFACAETGSFGPPEGYHRVAPIDGVGTTLGSSTCLPCHGNQPAPGHHMDCESCHGSGRLHVQNVLDPALIRFPSNNECLGCHEKGHRGLLTWALSEHARAGLLCDDCHDPHNGEPFHVRTETKGAQVVLADARPDTKLCVSCHPSVGAKLNLPSHHPIREGMMGCTDCHGPHDATPVQLGSKTARCTECHQAQAGPWPYEHTPVAEDCGYCHVPHGAVADNLLTANQPGPCVFCHTVAEMGATHDPQAYVTRCTDCHGAIHGSYADPHLRR